MKNITCCIFALLALGFVQCKKDANILPENHADFSGQFYVQGKIAMHNDELDMELLTGQETPEGDYYHIECSNPVSAGLKLLTSTLYVNTQGVATPVIAFNFNSEYDPALPNASLWTKAEIEDWFVPGKQIPFGWADGKVWIRFSIPWMNFDTYRSFEDLNEGNLMTIESLEDFEWTEGNQSVKGKMLTVSCDKCVLQSTVSSSDVIELKQLKARIFLKT